MADKVKALKMESVSSGGGQTDPFPVEANPMQDYLAAKGLSFEGTDDKIFDLSASGEIQYRDAVKTTYLKLNDIGEAAFSGRAFLLCQYGGNATAGRFLEFFSGIDSNEAPIYYQNAARVATIVARATATSTGTIGIYDNTTLLYTITFTAQSQVILSGSYSIPVYSISAASNLKIKVDSGSIQKPHIYQAIHGG